ncbi:DUF4446 family protein [Anaerosacchariphilus polymeriproducens]|uniref:DUF4446 family protein n=1 Tax=Anaerosacchariphilus polymeriproducens TaxID=1812858 RepID=A0A371AVF1_9FIRM|nr:DUF4446 family protein [Anaerosacchariphilus polymeriproducens]RDU23558.1 DUF4446 family protein [Anaerosacchariphilus polymeriproducens]
MNSELLNTIGIDPGYFIVGLIIAVMLMFLLIVISMVKLRKLNKKYNSFMKGKDAKSLEDIIIKKLEQIEKLVLSDKKNRKEIKLIKENLEISYQKLGIVKYDAFNEMGGKLSFALALLDKKHNGFLINAVHSRSGCYTYIKEIVEGKSYIVLAEEEKVALDKAINPQNYSE